MAGSARLRPRPGRTRLLRVLLLLPFLLVVARLLHLQWAVAPLAQARQRVVQVRLRPLPPTRGEIRLADGRLAATMTTEVAISVHYQALARPLDHHWLRQLAKRQAAQRPPLTVPEAMERLREQILQLIPRLAAAAGRPVGELEARAATIRLRVTRIRQAVLSRRRAARPPAPRGWLNRLRDLFADPTIERRTRLVLKEETWYYPLVYLSDYRQALEVLQQLADVPVVRLECRSRRRYPSEPLAAHVLGYVRSDGDGRWVGVAGVEGYYDRQLAGRAGWLREVRFDGEPYRATGGKPPEPGTSIGLSIDPVLQERAELELRRVCRDEARSGAVVLMQISTGRLLAAASWPTFLPSRASYDRSFWQLLAQRRPSPLLARFAQMALPPGSVFKLVTAAAALESGIVDPSSQMVCGGHFGNDPNRFRCWIATKYGGQHGALTLEEALARSCNVYFYELAVRLGPHRLRRYAERFGFGQRTGVDLLGETPGQLPAFGPAGRGNLARLLNFAIGQGELTATPLQVARLAAAIGNGGYLVRPTLALGRPVQRWRVGIRGETLAVLRRAMEQAAHAEYGTAHRAFDGCRLNVAAKTGTAETGSAKPAHAWCVVLFPAAQPRWVVVVSLEHGGEGGQAAARIARAMVEATVPRLAALPP